MNEAVDLELERRCKRLSDQHGYAWNWFKQFKDTVPDAAQEWRQKADLLAARMDELRLLRNALKRKGR